MPDDTFRIGKHFLGKRPNSDAWCACWYEPHTRQTKRASLGTAVFQEAQIRLAAFVTQNAHRRNEPARDTTIASVFMRYYSQHSQSTRSSGPNRRALELVLEVMTPGLCVADYTLIEQKRIAAHLKQKGLSAGYSRRVMGIAAAALNWSWKNGEIDKQMPITLPPEGEGRQLTMTIEEMAKLWDAEMPPHMRLFVALLIGTASRPEALLQLTREQCDLTHGIIDLNPPGRERTKKRRPRVPIAHFLRPFIEAAGPGPLITYHGKPIAKINKTWRTVRRNAGLPEEIVPYTIRHTMATQLITRGVPEIEVAALLGHSMPNLRTTGRYVHVQPDYLTNARKVIDEIASAIDRAATQSMVNLNMRAIRVLDDHAEGKEPTADASENLGFLPL